MFWRICQEWSKSQRGLLLFVFFLCVYCTWLGLFLEMRNTKLRYTTSWWASYSVCLSYPSPLQLQFRTLISGPKVVWAYNSRVRWTQQHWPNATGGVGRDTLPTTAGVCLVHISWLRLEQLLSGSSWSIGVFPRSFFSVFFIPSLMTWIWGRASNRPAGLPCPQLVM